MENRINLPCIFSVIFSGNYLAIRQYGGGNFPASDEKSDGAVRTRRDTKQALSAEGKGLQEIAELTGFHISLLSIPLPKNAAIIFAITLLPNRRGRVMQTYFDVVQ